MLKGEEGMSMILVNTICVTVNFFRARQKHILLLKMHNGLH